MGQFKITMVYDAKYTEAEAHRDASKEWFKVVDKHEGKPVSKWHELEIRTVRDPLVIGQFSVVVVGEAEQLQKPLWTPPWSKK